MAEQYRRCCGIDVHKDSVEVCVLPPVGATGKLLSRHYGTFRSDLVSLRLWLKQLKVTEIAMESTGVYWRPVWHVLDEQEDFELLLANPAQVKALRGRKSDRRDAQRIAEHLQDRSLTPSFVPQAELQELRMMLRQRISVLEQRNEVHNQIRDLFESVGVKLSSVLSDLLGASGQEIIRALIAGETSPAKLSKHLKGHARLKEKRVRASLRGCFNEFHRQMLTGLYEHYTFLTKRIEKLEDQLSQRMRPYAEQVERLDGIPGVDHLVAWHLVAELGVDMTVFETADQCSAWVGLVPGEDESAGQKRSTRCRKGNRVLRRVLTQAAWAASRCKRGYLQAFFHRTKGRRGWGKALVATAHKILVIVFHMLRDGTPYRDLGEDYFDRLHPQRTINRLTERIQRLGFDVQLTPRPLAPAISPVLEG